MSDDESTSEPESQPESKPKPEFKHKSEPTPRRRRGQIYRAPAELDAEVEKLLTRMQQAAEADDAAFAQRQPAVAKIAMLGDMKRACGKSHLHEKLIDAGIFTALSNWLRPTKNGSLVSLEIRSAVLQTLLQFKVDSETVNALISSGVGKFVKLLSLHDKETAQNKRLAQRIVDKWSGVIEKASTRFTMENVRYEVLSETEPESGEVEEGEIVEEAPRVFEKKKLPTHARVPRPMQMDFVAQPAHNVKPLDSRKHARSIQKRTLADRMMKQGRRRVAKSAMSVDGHGVDRM
tara:strand:- start:581 stop:1453 length:873 start_codon:yes stop_codon:yes gene_type:complete